MLSLKTKKNLPKKDASLDIARDRKKNIEKRERKTKNEKTTNSNNKYFFTLIFFK